MPGGEPRGSLLIVGGSERLDRELRLLHIYLALCNAVPGRRDIVVITSATGHPEALGGEYHGIFGQLGWPWDAVHVPRLGTPAEAADPQTAGRIAEAAGIYMTGGDQVELVEILRGTPAGRAMHAAYAAGAVIGGTSAGATAIGDPMIARGGGSGEPKRGEVTLHPGFGFAGPGLIIDTHFGRRGRFPRLVAAVGEQPGARGLGLDENTALLLRPGAGEAEVLGSAAVYVIESGSAGPAQAGAPFTLHVLREGQRYRLARTGDRAAPALPGPRSAAGGRKE